jgi:hypothetical protein
MNATPQDWLGSNQDPDVLLAVPNLGVDHIGLVVDNLRAHIELHAKVLDLLELHVGADVSIDKVDLQIDNVRVQAMLKVKLEKVAQIVDRVMDTIDRNPEILTNLTAGLGKGLEAGLGKQHAIELEKTEGRLKASKRTPTSSRCPRCPADAASRCVLRHLNRDTGPGQRARWHPWLTPPSPPSPPAPARPVFRARKLTYLARRSPSSCRWTRPVRTPFPATRASATCPRGAKTRAPEAPLPPPPRLGCGHEEQWIEPPSVR